MSCEDWTGHVIVCGRDGLALRITEELRLAGESVAVVDEVEELAAAGLAGAASVVCVAGSDLVNLEFALLVREQRPDIRVVTSIANVPVGRALAEDVLDTVLNVAEISAPSLVESCLRPSVRRLNLADVRLVMSQVRAPRDGTLRELFGELAPLVVASGSSDKMICPGRDEPVREGDRVTLIGTRAQLEERDLLAEEETPAARSRRRLRTFLAWLPTVFDEIGKGLRRALAALALLVTISTITLWAGFQKHSMSVVDSLYFTVATIATVGYGDFSFAGQPTWLRLFAVVLMMLGIACTATILAYFTDMLISRRIELASGRRLVTGMAGHVVLVGLGMIGTGVLAELAARDVDVVVVERDEDDPYLAQARELKVPIIFGDATQAATLTAAGLATARAVALLTSDDMVNIEAALAAREMLGERWREVPIVLRVFDRPLGRTIESRFGFGDVRSTTRLAAPWFVGAALGLDVLATFNAENDLFLAGRFTVAPGSPLDGLELQELAARTRVVAIRRSGGPLELSPRRATRFAAGDQAYAVGPYSEILRVLRRSRVTFTGNVLPEPGEPAAPAT